MDEKSIDLGSNLLTMTDERDTTGDELFTGVEDIDDDRELAPILTPEDRPRGILSPTDREYLCGHKEYAQPQTDANRRQAIRERVVNGLEDFALLSVLLEPGSGRRSSRSSGRRKPTRPLRRWSLLRISGLRGSSSVRDVSRARHPQGRLSANSPNQLVGRPTRTCPSRSSTTPISRRCISVSRTVRELDRRRDWSGGSGREN